MPCYDKKLEASRPDFYLDEYQCREVDCVLSTVEFDQWMSSLPESPPTQILAAEEKEVFGTRGGASGGYLEYIFEQTAWRLFQIKLNATTGEGCLVKQIRGDFREISLERDGKILLKFAAVYGFRNLQNLVRRVKQKKCDYHYVEVMACPSGCINGGGQIKQVKESVLQVYHTAKERSPSENHEAERIWKEWPIQRLLTQHRPVEKNLSLELTNW